MRAGDVIKEKYELTRLAGAGGMGEVFEAVNVRIGRKVAIKLLRSDLISDPRLVERFLREARSAAQIGSEHIVEILDSDETDDGVPFLVMEYLEGEDLGRLLGREGPLEPRRAVELVLQACRGLEAAHRKGIIHRDVKPGNIFLTHREDGTEWIKVLDFGIAKFRGPITPSDASLTVTGSTIGTPRYMAPEHLREARNVDERADVFSVGVILYEALTGDHPFQADTFADLIIQMVTVGPTPPSRVRAGLDEELDEIVLRALECDVGDRYASMGDLMEALESVTDRLGDPSPAADTEPRAAATVESDTIVPVGDDPWAEQSPTAPTRPARKGFRGEENEQVAQDREPRLSPPLIAAIVGIALVSVVVLFAVFFDSVPTAPGERNAAAVSAADAGTGGAADVEEETVSITVATGSADAGADADEAAPDAAPAEPNGSTARAKARPTPRGPRPDPAPSPAPEKTAPRPGKADPGGEPRFDEAFPSSTGR